MEDVTVATVAIWHCLEIIGEPQTIVVNIIMFSIKVAICSGSPSLPIHGDSHRCFPRRKIYAIEKLTGAGRSDGCCATSGIWSRKSGFFSRVFYGWLQSGRKVHQRFLPILKSPMCGFYPQESFWRFWSCVINLQHLSFRASYGFINHTRFLSNCFMYCLLLIHCFDVD